jgi:hypothetical protein
MAFLLAHFEVPDYDEWKQFFDSDPAGRKDSAVSHQIFQAADDPNKVFVGVEFSSAEEARSFRERLLSSGALDRVTVKTEPTVVESAEQTRY